MATTAVQRKTGSAALHDNSSLSRVWSYLTSLTSLPEKDTHFPLELPLYNQFLRRLDGSDGTAVPRLDGKLPDEEFHCRIVLIDDTLGPKRYPFRNRLPNPAVHLPAPRELILLNIPSNFSDNTSCVPYDSNFPMHPCIVVSCVASMQTPNLRLVVLVCRSFGGYGLHYVSTLPASEKVRLIPLPWIPAVWTPPEFGEPISIPNFFPVAPTWVFAKMYHITPGLNATAFVSFCHTNLTCRCECILIYYHVSTSRSALERSFQPRSFIVLSNM
jgi:hypothetical protein